VSESTGVTALLRRGIAAAKAGRKQEARQILMSVVEADEHNEQAWLWLSGVVDSLEDRLICVENVLAINPENATAQAGLRWLEQQGVVPSSTDQKDAEEVCSRCGAGLPAYGKRCSACGLLLVVVCPACGEYLDAAETVCSGCGVSLGNFREGAPYYLGLARAYLEAGQHTLVEEVLPYVLAEAQDNAQELVDVALLYESLHQTDRALSVYERVVELGHVDGAVYARLGEIYQQRGMSDKARALYAQARQRMGDDPRILLALARQHLESDATSQEAAALLERAIQRAPDSPEPYLLLARTYRAQDRMDAATKHYQRAIQLADTDSLLGREIRREVHRLDIAPSYQENHGWGETARSVSGLVLLPLFAALANARMSPLHISFASWVALLVASAGGYLLVSANEVTRNPGMCALFGEEGAKDRAQQMTVGLPGAALWFLALGAILLRV